MFTFQFNGKLLSFDRPQIMSIVNLNNDSFYSGSRKSSVNAVFEFIDTAVAAGSKIIDMGAISSRPYAKVVQQDEELNRILPILKLVRANYPDIFISIDTWRTEVARQSIQEGADMINDIYASKDDSMMALIAKHNIPYIMMHMQGNPSNMQDSPSYQNVCLEVLDFLKNRIKRFNDAGANQIILDPGFGFGKSIQNNYELLRKFSVFKLLNAPLLAGLSRKSMIHKYLKISADEALNGTTALHMFALSNGANILRVHDPIEASQTVELFEMLYTN